MTNFKVMNIHYRADIDGLRAFAVLAVIFFHINKNWLPHGYLGVDVFFVISGYLITSIIQKDMAQGQFNFKDFYIKRMRRILPVMWFSLAVTTLLATFILLPSDFAFYAKSLKSVLLLIANYFFAQEVDYFNPITDEYPLLHMWSLAVEEQFYFIWPLLLYIFLIKTNKIKNNIITILVITSFISYLLWLYSGTTTLKNYGYYSLITRMGGLCFGGAIAFTKPNLTIRWPDWLKSFLTISCFILTLLIMFYRGSIQTPFLSLAITLATGIIILFGPLNLTGRILSLKPFVYTGQISYSLYLWHWPFIAFLKYLGELNSIKIMSYLIFIFAISHFSKKYIEDQFRKLNYNFKKSFLRIWLIPSAIFFILAVIIYDSRGIPQRYSFSNPEISYDLKPFYENYCHEKVIGNCIIGGLPSSSSALLIGDSHASHFMPFFDLLAKHYHLALTARSNGFCFPGLEIRTSESENCIQQKKWFQENFIKFKTIILAARWEAYLNDSKSLTYIADLRSNINEIKKHNIKVVLIAQVPKFNDRTYSTLIRNQYIFFGLMKKNSAFTNDQSFHFDPIVDRANASIEKLAQELQVEVFYPLEKALDFKQRIPFRENGIAYKDSNHLNEIGAKKLAEEFIIRNITLPFLF